MDSQLQTLLDRANSSQPQALARALGVTLSAQDNAPLAEGSCLVELDELSEGATPELALKWTPGEDDSSPAGAAEPSGTWQLFLLAWNGKHWGASGLISGYQPISISALPGGKLIAVVIYSQSDDVPYPVIFHAHGGSLAWDSRADQSRYDGHRGGVVRFQVEKGILEMVERGRADPGLLVFSPEGRRGFEARAVYAWQDGAFIPRKTEYSESPDFTLYRFIAALHVNDYAAAYALVEPRKFLKTDKPSLKLFRQRIQDDWPEFLDDHIFRARDQAPGDRAFTLRRRDKIYVYTPSFGGEAPWLLTGLARRVEKAESE